MKKAEITIALLALAAVIQATVIIPSTTIFIVLLFSLLACFYMALGFAIFNNVDIFKGEGLKGAKAMRIIGAIGTGFALAITITGTMMKLQSFPGAKIELAGGLIVLTIISVIAAIKYGRTKSDYYSGILKRTLVYGIIGFIWLMIPRTTWLEFKYRNHPAFAKAVERSMADPSNEALQDSVDVERERMYKGK